MALPCYLARNFQPYFAIMTRVDWATVLSNCDFSLSLSEIWRPVWPLHLVMQLPPELTGLLGYRTIDPENLGPACMPSKNMKLKTTNVLLRSLRIGECHWLICGRLSDWSWASVLQAYDRSRFILGHENTCVQGLRVKAASYEWETSDPV